MAKDKKYGPETGRYRIRQGTYAIVVGDRKLSYPEEVSLSLEDAHRYRAILMERAAIDTAWAEHVKETGKERAAQVEAGRGT